MLTRIVVTAAAALVAQAVVWGQWVATEEAKLFESAGDLGDHFGSSVALSNTTVLIGVPGDDDHVGSAYVFVLSGTTWIEQAKLTASDGAAGDYFGQSVALSGQMALVGAPRFQPGAHGSAYVFVRSGTTWTEQQKLTPGVVGDQFGASVALAENTAVIGAPNGGANLTGRAYVLVHGVATWSLQQVLSANNGQHLDSFGISVAVAGDTALVGAAGVNSPKAQDAGAAYVFVRQGTTWSQQEELKDASPENGEGFGFSVALAGDTALIGVRYDVQQGLGIGSAQVFVRSGSTWGLQSVLVASGSGIYALGSSVDLDDDVALVGAPASNLGGGIQKGAALVFARSGSTWSQQVVITDSEPEDWANFGESVAIQGDRALVGAPFLFDNDPPGSASVIHLAPGPSVSYCTAGISASGCQALLSASGTPSATATSGFLLQASGVEGSKDGMYFWGTNGKQANPWGNGTSYQCVVPPVTRGGLLPGAGTVGACDGVFAQDLNAVWCPSSCPYPQKNPGPGAVVRAQLWYRDPLSTSNQTTSFSDAIEFVIAP